MPHNGMPWYGHAIRQFKFEVRRTIATSLLFLLVIDILQISGRMGLPGFQRPTTEIHAPPSEHIPLGGVCVYEPPPGRRFIVVRRQSDLS
jgi:hypothetical protein